MTNDEIAQAFAHPEVRAAATAAPGPLDRISLRDHVREVEIGAFEAERGVRQRLGFDVVVEVAPAGAMDDVDRVLSYDRLAEAVAAESMAVRVDLLETLADGIARHILREPQAVRAFVRIQKLDRPPGALGVEIVRAREAAAVPAPRPQRPRVAVLGPAEAAMPDLPSLIDALRADGAPLLLVAPPASGALRAETAAAGARVALLAADQGAWLLAARDPRLAVAASRTEIDWALRHHEAVVWAPARLALGEGLPDDPLARAIGFAASIAAGGVVALGPSLDGLSGATLPVRRGSVEHPLG